MAKHSTINADQHTRSRSPWKQLEGRSSPAGLPPRLIGVALVSATAAIASTLAWASMAGIAPPIACGPECAARQLPVNLATQASATRAKLSVQQELSSSPVSANAWLRLASIDSRLNNDTLGQPGLVALQNSYRFAPTDVTVSAARINFSFERWGQLTPSLRRAAIAEVTTLFSAPQNRDKLVRLGWNLQNPFGRVTYALLTAQLVSRDQSDRIASVAIATFGGEIR